MKRTSNFSILFKNDQHILLSSGFIHLESSVPLSLLCEMKRPNVHDVTKLKHLLRVMAVFLSVHIEISYEKLSVKSS